MILFFIAFGVVGLALLVVWAGR
jgi:hypothetical protein